MEYYRHKTKKIDLILKMNGQIIGVGNMSVQLPIYIYLYVMLCVMPKSGVDPHSLCQVKGLLDLLHTFQGLHYLLPSGLVSLFKPSIGYCCLLLPQANILFLKYIASAMVHLEAVAKTHCFSNLREHLYQLVNTGDDWNGRI